MEFTAEQAATVLRQAEALKTALGRRLLGQEREGWQCRCGKAHLLRARCVGIEAPDCMYGPGLQVQWYLWLVRMQELAHPEEEYRYSATLDWLLSEEEIRTMFAEYFGELIETAEAPDPSASQERLPSKRLGVLLVGKEESMSKEQHTSQEWALALDQLAENTFFAWRLITVNGRKLPIPGDEASYEAIVSLALGKVPPKDVLYTVVYGRGPAEKPEGSLLPGGSVKVRDGMVFSVANTGNA